MQRYVDRTFRCHPIKVIGSETSIYSSIENDSSEIIEISFNENQPGISE